eukprot:TRINITY_DN47247_c0_g1_i1.p1 TRINITY_DN47247_c0_g1~~TRINITY_DN47247_c0_g1_i1.p1  ORF type:complete len:256 (+),score=78.63 TRINITY_DN47247_c0_g1_i1:89-856(+)
MPKVRKDAPNEDFILPVVVGSIARPIDKAKAKNPKSLYEWVVYLRGVGGMSLEHVVDKVVIQLHKDMERPNRNIKKEPYETYDEGWGTFDLTFVVHLKKSVFGTATSVKLINYALVLEPLHVTPCNVPGGGGNTPTFLPAPTFNVPVAAERIDEIIISNPPDNLPTPSPRPVYPVGPKHWKVWPVIEKYRPVWMISESHQLARIEDVSEKLHEVTKELEEKQRELMWKKASVLQQMWLVEKAQKEMKKKKKKKNG